MNDDIYTQEPILNAEDEAHIQALQHEQVMRNMTPEGVQI